MLGHLEESVLLAVLELEKTDAGAFGLSVFNRLKDFGINVVNGTVYNTLDRLQDKGMLRSEITEPTLERGGRRKRIYFIEGKGLEALKGSYLQNKRIFSTWEAGLNNA